MIHEMNLDDNPFQMIKNRIKTIELRLHDERRKNIKIGDFIHFTNTKMTQSKMVVEVCAIHVFDSFLSLYKKLPLEQCGYLQEEVKFAKASDMDQYYTKTQQAKYGALGIEVKYIMDYTMFDHQIGLHTKIEKPDRLAARAIIIRNNKLLVLESDLHEVKLPGGGLENGESFLTALEREVKEETGYQVLESYEYGTITEIRNKKQVDNQIFMMISKYYLVNTDDKQSALNLQGYEIEKHFKPVFKDIDEVIAINETALKNDRQNEIAERELLVFKQILKNLNKA